MIKYYFLGHRSYKGHNDVYGIIQLKENSYLEFECEHGNELDVRISWMDMRTIDESVYEKFHQEHYGKLSEKEFRKLYPQHYKDIQYSILLEQLKGDSK